MDNEITINIEELLKLEDGSITDFETIRQIGLISCTRNDIPDYVRSELYNKVNRLYSYFGLYPSVIKKNNIK